MQTSEERFNQGKQFYQQKNYVRAERRFRQTANWLEKDYGSENIKTVGCKYWLGRTLQKQERYDEAAEQLRHVATSFEKILGEEHTDTLSSKHFLGEIFYCQNEYRKAKELFQDAIRGREASCGIDDAETLSSKHWLGVIFCELGQFNEAEHLLEQADRGREILLGSEDEDTLRSKHWLGCTSFQLEKYVTADLLFSRAAIGREKLFGGQHGDTLYSKHWLGRTLFHVARYTEAEILLRQTVEGRSLVYGEQTRHTLDSKHWLGRTLYMLGDFNGAEDMLHQAAEGGKMVLGEDHGITLGSLHWMRVAASRLERTKKRRARFDQVAESQRDVSHAKHVHFAEFIRESAPEPDLPVPTNSSSGSGSMLCGFFLDRDASSDPYSEIQISQISTLLEESYPQWSTSPRTYAILRIIGQLSSFNDLLHTGFSDYWLPVTERSLPRVLPQNTRAAFICVQCRVLSHPADLEKGRHCHFEALPLVSTGALGQGSYGWVDKVTCVSSDREYARKRVSRTVISRRSRADPIQQFVTEIEILKRLRHRHIVKIVGSYTDTQYVGLLMLPIAEMDLSKYLLYATETHHKELRSFFGCLASALAFQHQHKIRHKDIKPKNILVYRGTVLFTDFGLSLDFKDASGSTTTGTAHGYTPRYCAPEVIQYEPRNTKSDVWSLGIVFLEMLVMLKGMGVSAMDDFLETHGTREVFVRANFGAFAEFAEKLETEGQPRDNVVLSWVLKMLVLEPQARPTAEALVTWIQVHEEPGNGDEATVFCGPCCSAQEEDFSDLEMDVRGLLCDV